MRGTPQCSRGTRINPLAIRHMLLWTTTCPRTDRVHGDHQLEIATLVAWSVKLFRGQVKDGYVANSTVPFGKLSVFPQVIAAFSMHLFQNPRGIMRGLPSYRITLRGMGGADLERPIILNFPRSAKDTLVLFRHATHCGERKKISQHEQQRCS